MQPDDEDLVRACLKGEEGAFETLLRRYEKPVYNVALRMVGNPEDARDISQTAFLKAYRSLGTYDPHYKFSSWVCRIAVNEALNLVERRRPAEPVDETLPDPGAGPAETLDGNDLSRALQRNLMRLGADLRAVIILRHLLGCTYRDIAQVVGVPEKTVKSRLFSARQRLRELLEADGLLGRS